MSCNAPGHTPLTPRSTTSLDPIPTRGAPTDKIALIKETPLIQKIVVVALACFTAIASFLMLPLWGALLTTGITAGLLTAYLIKTRTQTPISPETEPLSKPSNSQCNFTNKKVDRRHSIGSSSNNNNNINSNHQRKYSLNDTLLTSEPTSPLKESNVSSSVSPQSPPNNQLELIVTDQTPQQTENSSRKLLIEVSEEKDSNSGSNDSTPVIVPRPEKKPSSTNANSSSSAAAETTAPNDGFNSDLLTSTEPPTQPTGFSLETSMVMVPPEPTDSKPASSPILPFETTGFGPLTSKHPNRSPATASETSFSHVSQDGTPTPTLLSASISPPTPTDTIQQGPATTSAIVTDGDTLSSIHENGANLIQDYIKTNPPSLKQQNPSSSSSTPQAAPIKPSDEDTNTITEEPKTPPSTNSSSSSSQPTSSTATDSVEQKKHSSTPKRDVPPPQVQATTPTRNNPTTPPPTFSWSDVAKTRATNLSEMSKSSSTDSHSSATSAGPRAPQNRKVSTPPKTQSKRRGPG